MPVYPGARISDLDLWLAHHTLLLTSTKANLPPEHGSAVSTARFYPSDK
jgi:hypothetical protein